MDKMLGGYQALQIRLLNGRIFQKLLSKESDAQYRSEQGKILTVLWKYEFIASGRINSCRNTAIVIFQIEFYHL